FEPPKAQRIKLENGIILYMLEDHEIPLVNMSAVIRMGSFYDPPGKEGLAEITGTVMRTGGTKSMTGNQIDEELDFIAGKIVVSVGTDSCTLSMSVLEKDIDKGLQIFSDILTSPVFSKEKMETAKILKIEALERISDNPQKIAFREFRRLMYHDDPRGRLSSVKSIGKIERDDLLKFYKRFFRPGNVMIALSGDIEEADVARKIKNSLGKWNIPGGPEKPPPPPARVGASLNYIYKDTPQSVIIIGQPAPGKESTNYYAFEVLDFITGSGGFRSRIFAEVRNRLGLAYSAGSFYSPRTKYGIFGAYAMAKGSSTIEALSTITKILDNVRDRGVESGEELAWAKESIINNFIFSFAGPGHIVMGQMMLEFDGLPDDFLITYKDNIEMVGLDDLRDAAARYLSEESRIVLVLGNKEKFSKPLSSFGDFHIEENCTKNQEN
ncbi:MAG: pitrilysin family protein, partial [Thermodesulfobacteriota bacterium]|nr:pitrilysin family protein [Thermodesulfobacteriota bacterium]